MNQQKMQSSCGGQSIADSIKQDVCVVAITLAVVASSWSWTSLSYTDFIPAEDDGGENGSEKRSGNGAE